MILHSALRKAESTITAEDMFEAMRERFQDPFKLRNAKKAYKELMIRQYADLNKFKNTLLTLAAEAHIPKENYKDDFFEKLYSRLQEGLARDADNPSVTFSVLCSTTASIARTYKSVYEKRQSENKQKTDKRTTRRHRKPVLVVATAVVTKVVLPDRAHQVDRSATQLLQWIRATTETLALIRTRRWSEPRKDDASNVVNRDTEPANANNSRLLN